MENNEGFKLDLWNFHHLRMTAFPSPMHSYEVKVDEWWREIVGDLPENIKHNPKVGLSLAAGPVKYGVVSIESSPNRIDLVVKEADSAPTDIQSTNSFVETLGYFDGLVARWMDIFRPVLVRLAFGARMVFPVPGKEDGYKLLQNFLHAVQIDPDNSSEFLYRINRPRASKTSPNISINRLNTWAVERNSVIVFPIMPGQAGVVQQQISSVRCSLELDINNKPETSLADIPSLEMFREFIELGKEIAIRGDIP